MRDPDGFTEAQESIAKGCSLLVLGWGRLTPARRNEVLRVLCESLADLEAPVPRWLVALHRKRLNTN